MLLNDKKHPENLTDESKLDLAELRKATHHEKPEEISKAEHEANLRQHKEMEKMIEKIEKMDIKKVKEFLTENDVKFDENATVEELRKKAIIIEKVELVHFDEEHVDIEE